jgi:hypothetical protein
MSHLRRPTQADVDRWILLSCRWIWVPLALQILSFAPIIAFIHHWELVTPATVGLGLNALGRILALVAIAYLVRLWRAAVTLPRCALVAAMLAPLV